MKKYPSAPEGEVRNEELPGLNEEFGKLRLRFLSLNGEPFSSELNRVFESFEVPEVLLGPPIFRPYGFDNEFAERARKWSEEGDLMVLVGDLGTNKSEFIDELVYRPMVVLSSDGRSGCPFIDKHKNRGKVSYLGLQRHLMNGETSVYFDRNSMSLGQLRGSISESEPAIRDSEGCVLSLSSLRSSDFPAKSGGGVSGLFIEEACQLTRYFGISDQSKVLWINGFDENTSQMSHSADVIAQLVWYFLDGISARKKDYPIDRSQLVEYAISGIHNLDSVVFYKSKLSGRWWFSLSEAYDPLSLHACSFRDYKMLCDGEISDRILRFLDE